LRKVAEAAVTGAEAAVTDLAAEVEDTLLSVAVVTDSLVVTHLADSPAVVLVRDSAGRGDFLTVVSFFNSLVGQLTGIPTTIRPPIPIWTTDRITTTSIRTIPPRLCNRNPQMGPLAIARL
jgi:hypothetical protein